MTAFIPVTDKPRLRKRANGIWECVALTKRKWWFRSQRPVAQVGPTPAGAYWKLMFYLENIK